MGAKGIGACNRVASVDGNNLGQTPRFPRTLDHVRNALGDLASKLGKNSRDRSTACATAHLGLDQGISMYLDPSPE